MKTWKFDGQLFRPDGPGMMTVLPIPSAVASAGGFHARQRVKGRINGVPLATSIQSSGDGWLAFVVNRDMLKKLGLGPGDTVKVVMGRDEGPVVVDIPPALQKALKAKERAKTVFDGLAPSHRKAYAQWISSAKRPETRDGRVRAAVQMLLEGRTMRWAGPAR
jgi:hypothetical protein